MTTLDTIRVCIGTEPKTEIARKVLEHSIRKRTKHPVEFTAMIGREWEYRHDFKVGTGFSLRRWMIPERFNWEGRAIYLDADQIVLGDIAELWAFPDNYPAKGVAAWMTYQPSKFSKTPHPNSSVMVIDCVEAKEQEFFNFSTLLYHLSMNSTQKAYAGIMYPNWMKPGPGLLPNEWNALNTYTKGQTKLLHYTKEPEQPWYEPNHPLAYLWQSELVDAINNRCITKDEYEKALSMHGVQEDWRKTNGLHPDYVKWLSLFK